MAGEPRKNMAGEENHNCLELGISPPPLQPPQSAEWQQSAGAVKILLINNIPSPSCFVLAIQENLVLCEMIGQISKFDCV